jgi:hypothetical protein
MNAAWVPLIGFVVLALGARWVAGVVSVRRGQEWVSWIVGVFAILCIAVAGVLARGTWIGQDAVPAAVSLHPVLRLAAGVAFIVAAVLVVLALLPMQVSSVAASEAVLLLVFLAPSLQRYLPVGEVGDASSAVMAALWRAAADVTGGWFG